MRILLGVLLCSLVLFGSSAPADDQEPLAIYFFYSAGCPHCHDQMPLMRAIDANNPDVVVHFHEVSQSNEIWRQFLEQWQLRFAGVPRTFIGETTFVGYGESGVALTWSEPLHGYLGNRVQIVKAVEKELGHRISLGDYGEIDEAVATPGLIAFWPLLLPLLYGLSYPLVARRLGTNGRQLWLGGLAALVIITVFLQLAALPEETVQRFAEGLPYPLFVSAIALADGFNPCAFTVLVILLSLLTYTNSRRDMLLIGGVFIATSAIMYFLFIMILVVIGGFFLERYGTIIMVALGSIIAAAGLLSVKDFFFLNRGFSLSLSEKQKLQFTKKASGIVRDLRASGGKLWLAIGGTVVLGVFVNLVELGCTAILPAVYMTTLVSRFDGLAVYSAWTALYSLVYILPLLAILLNFVYFFKSVRLTERQGRLLKLFAGTFMLLFGLLMIFKPELLALG